MLGDSRLGTISNRRLKAPTLSELRLGLEVNEGGSTRGSGIRADMKGVNVSAGIPVN